MRRTGLLRRGVVWLALAALAVACTSRAPREDSASVEVLGAAEGCVHLYVFRADWCAQCRYIKPAVLQVAGEYPDEIRVSLVLLDSPEGEALSQRYGVRCVPAALAVDTAGNPMSGIRCGFATYPSLRSLVEEVLQGTGCR